MMIMMIKWSGNMSYKKHAAWMAWYHSVCHAYVTESPFPEEMYGGPIMWNHAHTHAHRPKLVCRYFVAGVAIWLPLFESMLDEPVRAAINQAVMDFVFPKHKSQNRQKPCVKMTSLH